MSYFVAVINQKENAQETIYEQYLYDNVEHAHQCYFILAQKYPNRDQYRLVWKHIEEHRPSTPQPIKPQIPRLGKAKSFLNCCDVCKLSFRVKNIHYRCKEQQDLPDLEHFNIL